MSAVNGGANEGRRMKKGKGKKKVEKVMREFKHGSLKSSSGSKVTSRKQGIAIALSEAGMSKKKKAMKGKIKNARGYSQG